MIRPIRIYGDPVLHRRAEEVTDFDEALSQLVADMFETMDAAPGVGLAAPQIGVSLRVFVYSYPDDDDNPRRGVIINPELTHSPCSQEMQMRNLRARVACLFQVSDLHSGVAKK